MRELHITSAYIPRTDVGRDVRLVKRNVRTKPRIVHLARPRNATPRCHDGSRHFRFIGAFCICESTFASLQFVLSLVRSRACSLPGPMVVPTKRNGSFDGLIIIPVDIRIEGFGGRVNRRAWTRDAAQKTRVIRPARPAENARELALMKFRGDGCWSNRRDRLDPCPACISGDIYM